MIASLLFYVYISHLHFKSMAPQRAFFSYTTECYPDIIILPGAENLNFLSIIFAMNDCFIQMIILLLRQQIL